MSLGERIVRQITAAPNDPRLPATEPNPLQKAYDDYRAMERDRNQLQHECGELRIANQALMSEVSMLREMIERCEKERRRAQAVASTFAGQARCLGVIINDINELAIKNGIEAAETPQEKMANEEAAVEVAKIIERTVPSSTVPPKVEM
jgi:thiamine monophosphate synthase